MFANALTERLADFVRGIGIDVREAELPNDTFLPGLDIRGGVIFVDEARLKYPGDLLHEAGHLAVTAAPERSIEALSPSDGDEIATLAWSYAAARHLDLDPGVVFHEHGYKGGAQSIIDAFVQPSGTTMGVPLLQLYGMAVEPKNAAARGVEPFPHMLRWLR